jgi:hypothetical protein
LGEPFHDRLTISSGSVWLHCTWNAPSGDRPLAGVHRRGCEPPKTQAAKVPSVTNHSSQAIIVAWREYSRFFVLIQPLLPGRYRPDRRFATTPSVRFMTRTAVASVAQRMTMLQVPVCSSGGAALTYSW